MRIKPVDITIKRLGGFWVDLKKLGKRIYNYLFRRYFFLIVVILLFILANIGLFYTYRQATLIEADALENKWLISQNETERLDIENQMNLKRDLSSQIWSFGGTTTFKTVAVSIFLALLLAGLGKIFKIKEAFEERIRAQRQTRINNQKDFIKKTDDMWNELYCMVSEVRFYDKKTVEAFNKQRSVSIENRKKTIEEILEHSKDFASRAEEVVNQWHFVFPILPKIGEESNRDYINRLKCEKKKIIQKTLEKLLSEKVEEETKGEPEGKPSVTSSDKIIDKIKNRVIAPLYRNPLSLFISNNTEIFIKNIGQMLITFEDFSGEKIRNMSRNELKKYRSDIKKYLSDAFEKEIEKLTQLLWKCRRPSRLITFFMNVLYEAASSVAFYIREAEIPNSEAEINNKTRSSDEMKELQNSLGVIQDVIKDMVHQYMIAILKCAVEPQDGYGDEEQDANNKKNIKMYMDALFDNYIKMNNILFNFLPLPNINTREGRDYHDGLRKYLDKTEEYAKLWGKIDERLISENELDKYFDNIKANDIVRAWEFKYSGENLKEMAKQLSHFTVKEEISDRTQWLSSFDFTEASKYWPSE